MAVGTASLTAGIVGIFLPILPATTPFLLLSAACDARSSRRFHDWLMSNRFFGEYIKNYVHAGRPAESEASSWPSCGSP